MLSVCLSCLSVCPVSPVCAVCDVGVSWASGWMDQDETWHGGRPRPRPHCVRWEPSSPPQKGHSPQFSAHVCCGQTAGWIKMPLVMEVGLDRGHIVLAEAKLLPGKGHCSLLPVFGPCLLWPNGRPSHVLLSSSS